MFSGDYNLTALDYLDKCGLHWVGNCNELNAGMSLAQGQREGIGLQKVSNLAVCRIRCGRLCTR